MVASSILRQFSLREGWCNNGRVRLHYVESNRESPSNLTPLLYGHSAFGTAEDFIPEMMALSPRRCIGCSLRGRGKSDAPEEGYSFQVNVSDLAAIVSHLGLGKVCLMGWSIGVTYSIAYTAQHPEHVSGLILLDYPARHPKWPSGWAERWLSEPSIKDNPDRIRGLRGLERESEEVMLWDRLNGIRCPILVVGGGAEERYSRRNMCQCTDSTARLWKSSFLLTLGTTCPSQTTTNSFGQSTNSSRR